MSDKLSMRLFHCGVAAIILACCARTAALQTPLPAGPVPAATPTQPPAPLKEGAAGVLKHDPAQILNHASEQPTPTLDTDTLKIILQGGDSADILGRVLSILAQ